LAELFTLVVLALTLTGTLMVLLLIGRRFHLVRDTRRRIELESRLRPVAFRLIDGEDPEAALDQREAQVLAEMLTRFARQLSGDARDRIARFFENEGDVDREIAALSSRREWRRATAAHLLGDMGSSSAIQPLHACLLDPARDVRAAAARSLGKLGATQSVEPLVESLAHRTVPRAVASQALFSIGAEAVPVLRELVTASDPDVRAAAVELIGMLGGPYDARALGACLRDTSAEVRAKAARALGRLGTAESMEALLEALDDRIAFVRTSAAHALGMVGDTSAVPALLDRARIDDFDPAQAAAGALARLDPLTLEAAARVDGVNVHLREAADRRRALSG
jgi:HEAT repeat protein